MGFSPAFVHLNLVLLGGWGEGGCIYLLMTTQKKKISCHFERQAPSAKGHRYSCILTQNEQLKHVSKSDEILLLILIFMTGFILFVFVNETKII